jgi:hypothetical protein
MQQDEGTPISGALVMNPRPIDNNKPLFHIGWMSPHVTFPLVNVHPSSRYDADRESNVTTKLIISRAFRLKISVKSRPVLLEDRPNLQ